MPSTLPSGPQSHALNPKDDSLTKGGALTLAHRIRAFWARKGLYPAVVVERVFLTDGHMERQAWQVRSNMVGGWPV